jgi:paraquat-inducible protein B
MAPSEQDNPLDRLPEAEVETGRKGLSAVWLLPIVALLVGVWLVVKTVSERGPEIVVSFKTAEGIQAGKTEVKLKDVTVGNVESVTFSKDLSQVLVTIQMIAGAGPHLTDKTRFWVVRPRVGAGEISGLGTLFSGAYIAMDPDDTGKSEKRFTGLEKPPVITADRKGTHYRLRAEKIGSISVGTPVYFREFQVGEVTEFSLSEDDSYVDVGIFVEAPHNRHITTMTRFWNASGVSVSLNASGMELSVESLVSLLSGGITFANPKHLDEVSPAPENFVFTLYPDKKASQEEPITNATTFALRFDGTVRGLEVGAPVEYLGIRMGTVTAIQLGPSPQNPDQLVPVVLVDLEPQRLQMYRTVAGAESASRDYGEVLHDPVKRARSQVEQGLRARLQTGNLITGKLFVTLDVYPDAPPATLTMLGVYPEIPTMPGSLEGILAGIQRLVNRLDAANIEQTIGNLNKLLVSTNTLMAVLSKDVPTLSTEMQGTLVEMRSTFKNAAATLQTLDRTASPRGEIGSQLQETLQEVSGAARSIRVLTDFLERHPEALLTGKGAP